MPPTHPFTGFRIQDSGPHPRFERHNKGSFNGGAWHPDSQRIGVPGILSGSVTSEGGLEFRSSTQETGHGDKRWQ
jgi:hypothetical protein